MLKNIPSILSPELLKLLCEMGHSDKLVIADGNFPAESIGKNAHVIRMDGHGVIEIMEAILKLFPLDTYTDKSVLLMEKVPGDETPVPIWEEFKDTIQSHHPLGKDTVGFLERFNFYEEAKKAYLIIATSETALYANVMLQKGVVVN